MCSDEVDAIVSDFTALASADDYVAPSAFFTLASGSNRMALSYTDTTLGVMRAATTIWLPVLSKNHWVLAIANTESGEVTLLDSLAPTTGKRPAALWKCIRVALSYPWEKVKMKSPTWLWQGYTSCTQQPEIPPGITVCLLYVVPDLSAQFC